MTAVWVGTQTHLGYFKLLVSGLPYQDKENFLVVSELKLLLANYGFSGQLHIKQFKLLGPEKSQQYKLGLKCPILDAQLMETSMKVRWVFFGKKNYI